MKLGKRDRKTIETAESTKYLGKQPPSGRPDDDLQTILDIIGSKGWVLVERSVNSPWADWTTTFHLKIALEHGFYKNPSWQQEATLWHENVHIDQRLDIGRHRFNLRYIGSQRYRLIYEAHAYRESVRNLKSRGANEQQIEQYITYIIRMLRYKYKISMLRKAEVRDEIRRILRLGASDWS